MCVLLVFLIEYRLKTKSAVLTRIWLFEGLVIFFTVSAAMAGLACHFFCTCVAPLAPASC